MKCAIELLEAKGIAIEAERRRVEAEEQLRAKAVRTDTIKWCEEELANALLKEATDGTTSTIEVSFPVRFNDDEFCLLTKRYSRQGNLYYEGGSWKNFNVLRDYLHAHCLEVSYKYNRYPCFNGNYYKNGALLTVFVPLS